MIWSLILIPVLGGAALLIAVPRRAPASVGTAVLASLAAAALAAAWLEPATSVSWGGPLRLELAVTGVARILVVLVPVVAAPIVAFAGSVYRDDPGLPRLIGLLVAFAGAMELLLVAADLLTLLIAWELVAAFSWALIAHHWREAKPPQAALEAFVTVRFGAIGLFVAAGAAYAATGSLSFGAIAGADSADARTDRRRRAAGRSRQVGAGAVLVLALLGHGGSFSCLRPAALGHHGRGRCLRAHPPAAGARVCRLVRPGRRSRVGLVSALRAVWSRCCRPTSSARSPLRRRRSTGSC